MTKARDLSQVPNASLGFKNRLINSDMRIDQRNAGASVTINTGAITYSLDRWAGFSVASEGVFTINQSTTVPSSAGFVNSLAATCTTADASIGASNRYFLNQAIEGNNIADLRWGTANAQTITLSFWVQSSLTGTYCASILNGNASRSYVAEYTINAAGTWEYKTITIAGDTTGTWSTNESVGLYVRFGLAIGSTYQTTANAWAAGNFNATSNQVNWMSSSASRVFRITGVQLEKGSTATSFDYRPYGTELMLCQRYYQRTGGFFAATQESNELNAVGSCGVKVDMRATPTATLPAGSRFHRPGIAFYAASAVDSGPEANGNGYQSFTIASGAGGGTSGQIDRGLILSAEL
jgi:hypothetical protein